METRTLNTSIDVLIKDNPKLTEDLTSHKQALETLQRQTAINEKAFSDFMQQQQEHYQKLLQKTEESLKQTMEKAKAEDQKNVREKLKSDMTVTLDDVKKENAELVRKLFTANQSLDYLQTAMQQQNDAHKQDLQKQKEAYEQGIRRELEESEKNKSMWQGMIWRNMAGFVESNNNYEAAKETLKKRDAQIAEQTKQIKDQTEKLASLKSEIEKAEVTKQAMQAQSEAKAKEFKRAYSDVSGKLSIANVDLEALRNKNAALNKENTKLNEKLEIATVNAKKTPKWKYVLGGLLFVAGALLTATGVGAVAGLPMQTLGAVVFGFGAMILVSEFLYGAYNAIKSCFTPKNASAEMELSVSREEDAELSQSQKYSHARRITLDSPLPQDEKPARKFESVLTNRYSLYNSSQARVDNGLGIGDVDVPAPARKLTRGR